jgi:hypothetical protein
MTYRLMIYGILRTGFEDLPAAIRTESACPVNADARVLEVAGGRVVWEAPASLSRQSP